MTRKIGETFEVAGLRYKVVKDTLKLNTFRSCDAPCGFRVYSERRKAWICSRLLRETGDCKPRYREDHTSVYFERI